MTRTPNRFCEGTAVYLRPANGSDAELVTEWKNDPYIRQMALDPGTATDRRGQEADIVRSEGDEGQLYLMVVLRETDEAVGYVRVNWMDDERRTGWLRFAMGRGRGKGYAKDALASLLTHLAAKGLHRVDAEVYEFNRPSRSLLEGLGFRAEGVKREAHFDGADYCDVIAYGLLARELRPPAAT